MRPNGLDHLASEEDLGVEHRLIRVELRLDGLCTRVETLERRAEEQHEDVMRTLGSMLEAQHERTACVRSFVERITNPKVLMVLALALLVLAAGTVGAGVTVADWLEVRPHSP